jgi:hypothetical protein
MDAALAAAMAAGPDEREAALAAVNDIYVADFATPVFATYREGIAIEDGIEGIVELPTFIYLFHDAVMAG